MKIIKDLFKMLYSWYRREFKCIVAQHRFSKDDPNKSCCTDCKKYVPPPPKLDTGMPDTQVHIHTIKWTGVTGVLKPAAIGRFATAGHQWLFEGICTTCNKHIEEYDPLPHISEKLTKHLKGLGSIDKDTVERIFKENN